MTPSVPMTATAPARRRIRTNRVVTGIARGVALAGLGAVGALHVIWATGSPWPAATQSALGRAVAGTETMPPPAPTAVVGAGFIGAGVLAAGAGGAGRVPTYLRVGLGSGLMLRAVAGGTIAARALQLGEPVHEFKVLDRRYYRTLCAVLGLAVFVGVRRRRP